MAADPKEKRPQTDWEAIEKEYRAGMLSEAEIARQHKISRAAIQKRAKKNGWSRDLSEKVRQEISTRLVAEGLQVPRDAATVEQAAERGVALVREHRKDIGTARTVASTLLEELQSASLNVEELEDLILEHTEAPSGEAETKAQEAARLRKRDKMLAAIALPARAQTLNNLANALKTVIGLERQAFGIDAPDGGKANEPPPDITPGMTVLDAAEAYAQTLISHAHKGG